MRVSTVAIASFFFAASAVALPMPDCLSSSDVETTGGVADTACFKLKRDAAENEDATVCPLGADGNVDPDTMDTACFKVKRSTIPAEAIEACPVNATGDATVLDTACFRRYVKI